MHPGNCRTTPWCTSMWLGFTAISSSKLKPCMDSIKASCFMKQEPKMSPALAAFKLTAWIKWEGRNNCAHYYPWRAHTWEYTHTPLCFRVFFRPWQRVESEDNTLLTAHQAGEGNQIPPLKVEMGPLITVACGPAMSGKLKIHIFYQYLHRFWFRLFSIV